MRRPLLATLVPSLALGAALSACGGRSHSSTIQYYLSNEPRSLDPALSTDVPSGEMVALLYDGLTQFDQDGHLVPALASRWEIDAAGTTYTFHLRPGIKFHDGAALTARDVAASWLRALDPKTGGGRAWPLLPIAGAKEFVAGTATTIPGIRVADDTTLVVRIDAPLSVFPKLIAMPVAAVAPSPLPADFADHPVGSGPWRFAAWEHGSELRFARNPDYWGAEKAEAESIRVRIIPEALTVAAEYESGLLHVAEVPFSETARWEQSHPAELQRRAAIRQLYVAINTTRGPLKDVRVRQALNYATDGETILRTVMGGRGVRTGGALPPGLAGYDSTLRPYPFDVAKAKALLAAAGHPNGIDLELWRTGRSEYARLAVSLQQSWAEAGIRVTILERDGPTARAASAKGDADLFLTDWYADYPDAEGFLFPLFHSSNRGTGGNRAFLSDAELDRVVAQMRTTSDTVLQARLARQADARAHELAPWVFLWAPVDLWALSPDLTGWRVPAIFNGQHWTGVRFITP
ncbi:MAG: ABC transporter substrate-binding protein [Gemmatimonadetes bacterium]|nr:ABC transporter substrate-binding protein [Gemmatimonadota bacterium]